MAKMGVKGIVFTWSSCWRSEKRHQFLKGLILSATCTPFLLPLEGIVHCRSNTVLCIPWPWQPQKTSQEAIAKGEEVTGPEQYPEELFHKCTWDSLLKSPGTP